VKNTNLNLYHRFENDFLISYHFGLKYSNYYYKLSKEIDLTQINLDLANDIFDLFETINPSIDYLLNTDEDIRNSTFIPINTNIKNKATSILEDFRQLTINQELLDIFA